MPQKHDEGINKFKDKKIMLKKDNLVKEICPLCQTRSKIIPTLVLVDKNVQNTSKNYKGMNIIFKDQKFK